jgi:hypothetical protein
MVQFLRLPPRLQQIPAPFIRIVTPVEIADHSMRRTHHFQPVTTQIDDKALL